MYRFIETIRLQDGLIGNLDFHQSRMDDSIHEFYGKGFSVDLKEFLSSCPMPSDGLYKLRLIYDKEVQSVHVSPYSVKKINSLRIVHDNSITYAHKFEDRSNLERLFSSRKNCDDIIIVKNNHITDSSYANLVFKRNNQWFTPNTYLLNGTKRKQLLKEKIIFEEEVTIDNLNRYQKVKLINAMMLFDGPEIDVSEIVG